MCLYINMDICSLWTLFLRHVILLNFTLENRDALTFLMAYWFLSTDCKYTKIYVKKSLLFNVHVCKRQFSWPSDTAWPAVRLQHHTNHRTVFVTRAAVTSMICRSAVGRAGRSRDHASPFRQNEPVRVSHGRCPLDTKLYMTLGFSKFNPFMNCY